MTLKQLEIFLALAQNPHLSNVAKEKGLTQSAVSMAIKSLEENLEEKLFDRINKKLVLNEKGRLFFKKTAPLVNSLNAVGNSFKKNKLIGELTVGVSSSLAAYIMPRIIFKFTEQFKGVKIKLKTGNTREVGTWLEEGGVDLGFVEGEYESADLIKEVFGIDELFVVTGDEKLAEKEEYTMDELYEKRWVLREKGSGTREVFLNHLGKDANKINMFMELDHTEAVKSVLFNKDALSCLSQFTIEQELKTRQLFTLKIKGYQFRRMFYTLLHNHKYKSLLLETFIGYANINQSDDYCLIDCNPTSLHKKSSGG